MSRELESTTPSASETSAKIRAVELELEPKSSSTLAPFSDALDILDMGKDKLSNKISNESNPRKRKSDFKERKRVVESRKSNKRRRLFKRSEPKAPGTEVAASSSPAPAEVDASRIQELQKVCVLISVADFIRNTNTVISNNSKSQTRGQRSTEFGPRSASFSRAQFGNLRHPVRGPGGPHLSGGFLRDRTQKGREDRAR